MALSLPLLAQGDKDSKATEEYQNRQRALSLILLDSKIKSLDDAPMRCMARIEVIRFLVESGPDDLHPYAFDFAKSCLDETVRNAESFPRSAFGYNRTQAVALIRKIDKQKADALETEYPVEGYAKSFARSNELEESEDPTRVTAKVIEEIRSGTMPTGVHIFVGKLRQRDPILADAVLDAALRYYESRLSTLSPDRHLYFLSLQFMIAEPGAGLRTRMLTLALNLGRRALADRSNDSFTKWASQILQACVRKIEEEMPAALDEANSIIQTLRASQSATEAKLKEIFDRIESSEDKVKAMIAEAEGVEDEVVKRRLITTASSIALFEGRFRLAIDAAFTLDDEVSVRSWRPFFLRYQVVNRALKSRNLEVIDYLIDRLDEPFDRADVCLKVAAKLAEDQPTDKAAEYLRRGLQQLRRSEGNAELVAQYAKATELSAELKDEDIFGVAREAVAAMNRLPGPDLKEDDQLKARMDYVSGVLLTAGTAVTQMLDPLAEKDPDQAYTISQGIQRRDLRLMAEISVEKFKKYPLPRKEEN
ncbi:MAG: hypothetical protein IPM63_10945 [Acidobacteriota bacterium]|nr:MAG: hypothetical protein IPM63_10945 [Acidobacteriota bacterium]